MSVSNPQVVDRQLKAADCGLCQGKPDQVEVVNHDLMWHDGDVICGAPNCGRFVRDYDAG